MKRYLFMTIMSVLFIMAAVAVTGGLLGCDTGEHTDQATSTIPVTPTDQPEIPDSSGPPMPPISDADLERAAAAYTEITRINQDLQQAVQQTQDIEERQKLQLEANERMVQAAENAGLNFETYNYIMQHVRSDTQLDMMFQKKVQALE
jgi:hypothetical protein